MIAYQSLFRQDFVDKAQVDQLDKVKYEVVSQLYLPQPAICLQNNPSLGIEVWQTDRQICFKHREFIVERGLTGSHIQILDQVSDLASLTYGLIRTELSHHIKTSHEADAYFLFHAGLVRYQELTQTYRIRPLFNRLILYPFNPNIQLEWARLSVYKRINVVVWGLLAITTIALLAYSAYQGIRLII